MNKCRVYCKNCKVVDRGDDGYDFYCMAQKDMPRVNPYEEDCPYNILINEDMKAGEEDGMS